MSAEVHHPLFARLWPRLAHQFDRQGGTEHRRKLVAGLEGRVVEVGAGDGRNFAHYPSTVTEVVAVEPEARLRSLAEEHARRAPVEVRVIDGVAERLPLDAEEFDAGVFSLVLCSVQDPAAALAEIRRVLRPGGRMRYFEHVVASPETMHRRVQRFLDATIWPRVGGGCHTARDTLASIRQAGLEVVDVERFRFPDTRLPMPTSPHISGEAVVP